MRAYVLFAAVLPFSTCAYTQSCTQACTDLTSKLPSGSVKSSPDSDAYWAAQVQSIQAACYVQPTTTDQVATVLKSVTKYNCQFAIRSGGHSDVAGASNIAGGLVLNLDAFNGATLSANKKYAVVGAGQPWGDVYTALDPLGYTVIGGRESSVGVGGLLLGGGVSYFSGRYGLACDNVLAYEVVLANGTAATISASSAPDLYRALRGGGNNFAVVTRFHLAAYAYDELQGGLTIWSDSDATQASQVAAFSHFAQTGDRSPAAAMFLSLAYPTVATPVWIGGLYYADTAPPVPAVPAYSGFYTAQLNASRVASTERSGKHADFATELGTTQPKGAREQFHTGMYVADADLLDEIFTIFRDVVKKTQLKLLDVLSGSNPLEIFTPALAFQPITRNILRAQSQRGGNVLGLDPRGPPLMLMSMSWPWHQAANDAVFQGAMDDMVRRADAAAKRRGLDKAFIYMNYAAPGQPVVQSYGASNVQLMRAVSKKYDPKGVFQKLAPGGFKLP